ncbi:response regulator [Tardiphaga sp. vice352]|uniref:response regulator n=1 Tax=unclassified Tardiphaga TaxID=2631404 RepID=UPI001161F9C5|nr:MULTISPECIES: response regulator [unclassified Tardiphaga]MBC7584025.1 response regulator [Tardiphaga sp.]QDM15228.1 response regulator [Tardiphaga sp. vice278]QDM20311.1 response regulator [Tardiphaga sp. vice154]QDM25397.1 response regulator [Tardiphaga sp. vice304]QDM30607.1 response regulator [Tardiphaga sp. vice352]
MTQIRILHVDDEPDIREVVEISLGIDPDFVIRSCGSGAEALVLATEWLPDVILMDVMMPAMDGPATLERLRENPATNRIPVIFMTARAQTRELDQFRALGAIGVVPKPFDPMTLAVTVRDYIAPPDDPLKELRDGFLLRLDRDARRLVELRDDLRSGDTSSDMMVSLRYLAHNLAGASGIYGYIPISNAAAALEDAIIADQAGTGDAIVRAIDALLDITEHQAELRGQLAHAESRTI